MKVRTTHDDSVSSGFSDISFDLEEQDVRERDGVVVRNHYAAIRHFEGFSDDPNQVVGALIQEGNLAPWAQNILDTAIANEALPSAARQP